MGEKAVWGKQGADYPFFDKVKFALVLSNIQKVINKKFRSSVPVNERVLLDVGCGYEARIIQKLQGNFGKCIGLDFEVSPHLKQNKKFCFFEGDMNVIFPQLESESIDFIIFLSILEHLDDPTFLLSHSRRILKKNGFIFFNSPSWIGKWVTENVIDNKFFDPYGEAIRQSDTHKMYYSPKDMWPLIVKAGFTPSKIKIWRSNFLCSISGYIYI